MTAPAVVRRWPDRPPVPVGGRAGRRTPEPDDQSHRGPGRARPLETQVREQVVRLRRTAPLGAVLLTGFVLHAAVGPHLAVAGAAPDAVLVAVVAVAAGRGARAGAAFGFAAGLGADLFLATPLGTSALAFTLLGHVFGHANRPRSTGAASALCSPGSACFACRSGVGHRAGTTVEAVVRPVRARRRLAARRAALRRSLVLTLLGVAIGRIATAAVATSLAGVPFPGTPGLLRIAATAVVSAPLGPPMFAAVRRLTAWGRGRH